MESSLQRYKRLRYQGEVIMGPPSTRTANATMAPTSPRKSTALRAYRLNLERPFDILNEQSPLEYGDYMKVWEGELFFLVGPWDDIY
jgi:hypothetical protein